MAIFRGTGGSGNSTDDSIVSAVTEQAGIATTKAGEAATSATTATTKASEASASATTASTKATEAASSATTASTKATEANTAKTAAEAAQTAAEAARDTAQTHANTANNSSVQTVAGISTEVQNVNNIRTEIQNVDTIKTDVTTVAGISSNVTTVAADASDIGTVATNITNVNNVGDNIANVNAVHSNASNINTVAADGTDIGTVSSNISNVNTVAGISSDVTTVAGLESKMDTVIADASDIGAVANNIGDVTTVAGINSEVDTVAGISAKVTTVADNITDVQNADTNAANASASASQAANSASAAGASATTASTKATEASNSATVASNSATTATTKATEAAGSATTATTKATEASTSATNAATSATTATTKASEASSSATAASGSATTATTKASEASVSAASAATSATDASNAENAWSSFYNSYLGTYSSAPSVDVQGNPIVTGAFYYDTGAGSNTVGLYVYNGSTWVYSTNYNNVTAPYSLAQDLATNSYDISFGDNAKAKFGASDDLQIYHTGTNSILKSLTGEFLLQGNGITLRGNSPTETMLTADVNGAVTLHYDSLEKLATTSTGIDVTGTVTSDGLIVNGNSSSIDFTGTSGSNFINAKQGLKVDIDSNSNQGAVDFTVTHDGGTKNLFNVDESGDISFFEDTGTTAKFFWDASTERLGIGTSSPSAMLDVELGATGTIAEFRGGDSDILQIKNENDLIVFDTRNTANGLAFQMQGAERMRMDVSGNVGIGTTSPNQLLSLNSTASTARGISIDQSGAERVKLLYTNSSGAFDINNTTAGYTSFSNNGAERMRIDSLGNLLVGKTATGTDNGVQIEPAGAISLNRDGSTPLYLNRKTSDGTIADFRKDGTTVGSIGSRAGLVTYITSGGTYSGLDFGTDINPMKSGALSDGQVNLGASDQRFSNLYLSGNVHTGDGTAASPAYTFGDDTDTGIFSPAADTIAFSEGGTEAMRIDSSGYVGIGTTSPNSNLELSSATGSATISPTELRITSSTQASDWSTTDSWGVLAFHSKDTSGGGAGNLAEISANMENSVGGFASIDFTLQNPASSYAHTSWLKLRNSSSVETRQVVIEADGGLTVDNKVGIGTTSPDSLMHLSANTGATLTLESTDIAIATNEVIGAIDFYSNDASGIGAASRGSISLIAEDAAGAGSMLFKTSNAATASTERMRIDSSGNVGIGTTSPDYPLEVSKAGTSGTGTIGLVPDSDNGHYIRYGGSGTNNNVFRLLGTGNTERLRIDSSGNVLVGKTSNLIANVGGTIGAAGYITATRDGATPLSANRLTSDGAAVAFYKDSTQVGSISVTSSATAYNTSSDERLKENIQDSADAGSKIDAIQIRQFDWRSDGAHQDYGVIAQELLEVAPEAVTEGETEDDMMSVDYSKLVPTLIKEIQSLRNRVAQLENN